MANASSLTPIFVWLKQKPKNGSKKHILIYDQIDFDSFKENLIDVHPYYSIKEKLTGYATRKSLRKLNLVSKASHVFVLNTNGKLFLQRRAPTKDIFPNLIAPSASGHVDLNETPKEAAIRELKEELGITATPKFMGKIKCFTPQLKEFLYVYTLITNKSIKIDQNEISEGFFVPFLEIYKKPLFSECVPAMQKELIKFKLNLMGEIKR